MEERQLAPGLYVFAAPLGEGLVETLPLAVLQRTLSIRHWVVESEKSARRFLLAAWRHLGLSAEAARTHYAAGEYHLLNEHTDSTTLGALLAPATTHPLGLLSDGGAAAVADPGAPLAALAHRHGVRVFPQAGPSSVVLALMASGLNGQGFVFHGYPPRAESERRKWLQQTEQHSRATGYTQLCIETPYRNPALLQAFLASLRAETRLCVALELTLASEDVRMHTVLGWKAQPLPEIKGRPAVFLWQA